MNGNSALLHATPTWIEKSRQTREPGIALLPDSLKTARPSVAKNYDFVSADWVTKRGAVQLTYLDLFRLTVEFAFTTYEYAFYPFWEINQSIHNSI